MTQHGKTIVGDAAIIADRDARIAGLQTALSEAIARAEKAEADKTGLRDQISKLLTIIDDWDKSRADEYNGGMTMHTRGMTPDWYVEAAFWACYGYGQSDQRALHPVMDFTVSASEAKP